MGILRSKMLLLLITTLSHNALGRPQAEEDVKIITNPSPGQEYVAIHNGKTVIPLKQPKQLDGDADEGFSTSHKIPSQVASEKLLASQSATKPKTLFSASQKISRYHGPLVKRSTDSVQKNPTEENNNSDTTVLLSTLSEAILTPDQILPEIETKITFQNDEIRTEYSVVTSKPRKVVPSAQHVPTVNVEPRGDYGVIEEKLEGPDEQTVMQKKLNTEYGKENEHISPEDGSKYDDSLISSVEVKPGSQVGVTSPKFQTREGDISVPLQKMDADNSGLVTTTTVLPLTSTTAGITKSNFDIIPVNLVEDKKRKKHEKDLDFEDSPLGDKLLVPAGSENNKQSRIEIKKGPNGQDYEYEYVYYYYDDEDNDTIATAGEKSLVSASPPTTTSTTTQRISTAGKRYLPTASQIDSGEEANHASSTRGRSRNRSQSQGAIDEENQSEHFESKPSSGRQRYTTIERNRGEASTTVVPESSNEVVPHSHSSRFRGRQLNLQTTPQPLEEATPVADERLPANTRFPPRSRSNHNSAVVTTPFSDEAVGTRGRSSGNSASAATTGVRRPSLELVDSSSFRTHSSDVARSQDLTSQPPSFPSVLPSGPFRFLGVTPNEDTADKEVKHRISRVRGRGDHGTVPVSTPEENADAETTSSRHGSHIRRPSTPSAPPVYEEGEELFNDESTESIPTDKLRAPVSRDGRPSTATEIPGTDTTADENTVSTTEGDIGLTAAMMDKAALDLYAIFQQAQDENTSNYVDENATNSSLEDEDDRNTTEEGISTTAAITITTTTTTTTTTTEAPTTTTTTTQAPTTEAAGSSRYKPRRNGHRGQNGQNKYRQNSASTTTTETAPVETSTRTKSRFGNNRTPVGGGSFGRRGQHKTSKPAEEEAVKQESKEVASTTPKSNGLPRTRFGTTRSARVTSTTAATPEAGSTSSVTHAPRPVFADRNNSRRRGPTKATVSTPASDVSKADNASTEDKIEPAAPSEPPASTPKTAGRARLNISSGPRPLRPGPKINIGSRPKPRAAPTPVATTQAAPTDAEQEGNDQASHPTTADDSQLEAQEPQETVTTPIPDALTRLRSRPRLHVTSAVKTTAAPAANSNNRRHLVSSLLPKRRPLNPTAETKDSEAAEPHDSEGTAESELPAKQSSGEEAQEAAEGAAVPATVETQDAPRENRLSSLLSGRRRANSVRRPGTLLPSTTKQSSQE